MTPTSTDPDPDNLTRKQRRDQAREQRRTQEQEQAAADARQRRMRQLGIVIAVVIVAIVVIVIATKGSKNPATESSLPKTPAAKNAALQEVQGLIGGISQKGNVLGKANAPLTLQYFGDLECPICKEFTLAVLPTLVQDYVRTGKMKIEYLSMETATREPSVFRNQQTAAYAAGKQDKAWYFIELFYHEQGAEGSGYVTEKYLQGLAQQVPGLGLAQWQHDRGDHALEVQVLANIKRSNEIGFTGTPSFMLGKTGRELKPAFEEAGFESPAPYESAINKLAG